jgi:hypothetical protein
METFLDATELPPELQDGSFGKVFFKCGYALDLEA